VALLTLCFPHPNAAIITPLQQGIRQSRFHTSGSMAATPDTRFRRQTLHVEPGSSLLLQDRGCAIERCGSSVSHNNVAFRHLGLLFHLHIKSDHFVMATGRVSRTSDMSPSHSL